MGDWAWEGRGGERRRRRLCDEGSWGHAVTTSMMMTIMMVVGQRGSGNFGWDRKIERKELVGGIW